MPDKKRMAKASLDVGSVILYCSRCWVGYASIGEIPAKCPACDRVTRWATQLPADVPKVGWELNANDRKFLKALRILGDEPTTHDKT